MSNQIKCPDCGVNKVVERTGISYKLGMPCSIGLFFSFIALLYFIVIDPAVYAMEFVYAGGIGIITTLILLAATRYSYDYYHCLSCKEEWEKTL